MIDVLSAIVSTLVLTEHELSRLKDFGTCGSRGNNVFRRGGANSVTAIRTALLDFYTIIVHKAFIYIGHTWGGYTWEGWTRSCFVYIDKIKSCVTLIIKWATNLYHCYCYYHYFPFEIFLCV